MRLIINAEPEEMEYVLRLIQEAQPSFERSGGKIGWGWLFGTPGKRSFFIREIKGGFSANPSKPRD